MHEASHCFINITVTLLFFDTTVEYVPASLLDDEVNAQLIGGTVVGKLGLFYDKKATNLVSVSEGTIVNLSTFAIHMARQITQPVTVYKLKPTSLWNKICFNNINSGMY